jgi:Protein of unknown function (DUF3631).
MWPKKPEEKAEDFAYADDPEFSTIRRKLARWAADNLSIIKELKPPQPPGFNNRLSANWKLRCKLRSMQVVVGPSRRVGLRFTSLVLHMNPA